MKNRACYLLACLPLAACAIVIQLARVSATLLGCEWRGMELSPCLAGGVDFTWLLSRSSFLAAILALPAAAVLIGGVLACYLRSRRGAAPGGRNGSLRS